ncbi:MAG: hypothetical protein AAF215_07710 [Cyanobacteria bacterium P01_A01_bin.123]
MIESVLARAAVGFLATKAAEGAAQTFGSEAYKTAIEKLKGFFSYKFAGKPELNQIQNHPDKLASLVAQEASKDSDFKIELEKLVTTLQNLVHGSHQDGSSYTNVDSVANIDIGSASNSSVAGKDVISKNQINGGQNYIGGDQRGGTFR